MNSEQTNLSDLLKQLRDDTTALVREEVVLAKTELSEKAADVSRNVALLVAGALLGYSALIVLLFSLGYLLRDFFVSRGMTGEMSTFLGLFIVGLITAAVSLCIVFKALNAFKKESLAPRKTIRTLKDDKEWVQNKIS